MSKSYSFDGTFVTFTTRVGENTITHEHGKPPADAFVVYRFVGAARLYRGSQQWTATTIHVGASAAGTTITLLLIGQEAQTVITRTEQSIGIGEVVANIGWVDASTTTGRFNFFVPTVYVSGDLTLFVMRRGAAVGTAKMTYDLFRFRDATAVTTISSATSFDFTPLDTNSHIDSIALAASNFQAGDVVRWSVARQGAAGGDTMAATVSLDGAWVSYGASS